MLIYLCIFVLIAEKRKASVKAVKKETTSSPKAPVGKSKTTTTSANLKSLLKDEKWMKALSAEFDKNYFTEIEKKLAQEYKEGKEIFPPKELIFNAFNLTPLDKVLEQACLTMTNLYIAALVQIRLL